MYGDGFDYTYCGDHFTVYTKSGTPETNVMVGVSYISVFKTSAPFCETNTKLAIEGNCLNIIKPTYENPTVIVILAAKD